MNYIGSKYSLIGFIQEKISEFTDFDNEKDKVFADLFAGTGIVGLTYRTKGYNIISNDIQYYSYILNKHYIENSLSVDTSIFDYLNSLPGIEGFVYNNYCMGSGSNRNYFSDENGMKCDAIRKKIEEMFIYKKIDRKTYFFLLASLINSIDKYANTASVYGAFLKKTKKSAQKTFYLEPLPVIFGPKGQVFNEDANNLIRKISGDILYLDPPYNARQYCTNYHVLETISKYDCPHLNGKTGLRDYEYQKSKYCSKQFVGETFNDLIANANFKYIFLSYNNEGLMNLNDIQHIMSKYGTYYCYKKDYRRFKADADTNRNIKSKETTEYLHCLRKKD